MASTLKITRIETGETNESSLASLDFAHTNHYLIQAKVNNQFNLLQQFVQNEKDILKIASFDQSIGTLVYVVCSIATLYTSDFDTMTNLRD
ncbi:unnamed protein product [Rotaria sp. Silwood1]|nr:unnamed protein product [Rotaria sp. Silwood1]CAF3406289.1 unnamed protein product [Rotaria sp. Silwood1]CAF4831360.1 unnamed protein product [Rotaria sp. Silwood1]CAF4974642.1 unnamed protein product [Rotaria sp. Silwood1]